MFTPQATRVPPGNFARYSHLRWNNCDDIGEYDASICYSIKAEESVMMYMN